MFRFFRSKKSPDISKTPTPSAETKAQDARDDSDVLDTTHTHSAKEPPPILQAERLTSPETSDPDPLLEHPNAVIALKDQAEHINASTTSPQTDRHIGWREKLRQSVFARNISSLFTRNPRLDESILDDIETALLTADVGVSATQDITERLGTRMKSRAFANTQALYAALRQDLLDILQPVARPLQISDNTHPFVILTVGVNGVGKTTSIGKLAHCLQNQGQRVVLAAGDTFRAGAVAQLQTWGERNKIAVIAQGQQADAASVVFDALQSAIARKATVLIADTAGRLHTQTGLMNELHKISRVLGKVDASAPHEVLMIIDGTTGQNAIAQLRQFHASVKVTGLIVTKLDGSAKGGVLFALAKEFAIPIRFVGVGERISDLKVFDPQAFVDALLPEIPAP